MKLKAGKFTRWFGLWWPLAMISLFSTISNFLSNRYQVTVQDLVVPMLLDFLAAAALTAGFYRMWRRDRLAGYIAAGTAMFALSGEYDEHYSNVYVWLSQILPLPKEPAGIVGLIGSLVFIGVIIAVMYWFGRGCSLLVKRLDAKERDISTALLVGVAATFVFIVAPLVKDLVIEWPQFFYKPPKITAATTKTPADKPAIYYIIMDRYASQDVLKQQLNFDNADFLGFLKDQQYYVNPSAHNNYPYTTMSVASTMSADYLTDAISKLGGSSEQTTAPFNESIRNSAVASKLKALGYSYDLIGNWYETSNLSPIADNIYQPTGRLTVFNADIILNNFSKNILIQSPFWRFLQPGLNAGPLKLFSYSNMGDVDMTHYQLQTLRQEAANPAGGRFVFAHILVPHDPYNFNADGSVSDTPYSDNVGEPIKQKYLGQVKYINSQMKDILGKINATSKGKAVVVLQSDEGPYPMQLNDENFDAEKVDSEIQDGDMRQWSDKDLQMKFGNLAAYHIPEADFQKDAAAADSVNIFRLVLNSYFGTGLPYLPDCYYAYADGRNKPLKFVDITARLSGKPADARCLADGRVKE